MIEALRYEYRCVAIGQDFNTMYMLKRMYNMLKHHRLEIRDVVRAQKANPRWVDKTNWECSKIGASQ